MDTDQLALWLGLPPGCWPPDDRTLLGFGSEVLDAGMVEARTLARMDQLRPHQLLHPDLVTEGMNRLAQAMIALSGVPGPVAGPQTRTVPPAQAMPTESYDFAPEEPAAHTRTSADFDADSTAIVEPVSVLDAEIVEAVILPPEPPAIPRLPRVSAPESPLRLTGLEPLVHPITGAHTNRRELYRTLAQLRRTRRAWLGLRDTVADPDAPVQTPATVCAFLEQCQQLRSLALWWQQEQAAGQNGRSSIWFIVTQPTPLAVFRALLPSQRTALARDWFHELATLEHWQLACREYLESTRPVRGRGGPVVRGEWILLAMSLAVVLLAIGRWSR